MANFYRIDETKLKYSELTEALADTTEEERVDLTCYDDKEHEWLLLPEWCDGVQTGGKQYIMCLNCLTFSHL